MQRISHLATIEHIIVESRGGCYEVRQLIGLGSGEGRFSPERLIRNDQIEVYDNIQDALTLCSRLDKHFLACVGSPLEEYPPKEVGIEDESGTIVGVSVG